MPARSSSRFCKRNAKGQAAVELALLLPLILLFVLLVVQIGLVVERQIIVVNAAREGAREGTVSSSVKNIQATVRKYASLEDSRTRVSVDRAKNAGGSVRVEVDYVDPTDVALVGRLLPDINLSATVVMRTEQ